LAWLWLVASYAHPFLVLVTYIGPQIVTYIGPQIVTYIGRHHCHYHSVEKHGKPMGLMSTLGSLRTGIPVRVIKGPT